MGGRYKSPGARRRHDRVQRALRVEEVGPEVHRVAAIGCGEVIRSVIVN
jgi:hypothetical protein